MRTTITLERDLYRDLCEVARRAERSFDQVVNEMLRAGLSVPAGRAGRAPFRQETFAMGDVTPGLDLAKALRLASSLEDEERSRG